MTARLLSGLLAAVAVVVAVIVVRGGDDGYTLRVPLENASGLKTGSPVVVGGVTQGEVELDLTDDDRVVATLKLKDDVGPVGRDARVSIAAQNFLGQKRVQLVKGDAGDPAPSGFVVPAQNITTPTDLDQVFDVLDADTRTRAMILLNEAGSAVVGRRVDIRTLIREFPIGLVDGTRVLRRLDADDEQLGRLVEKTDRLVAAAARERRRLTGMVDVVGDTAANLNADRGELRATLARAPRTLATLQGFLGELERTAAPLRPAARAITASAAPLDETLRAVEPFGDAAVPALRKATTVAPLLTRLATDATPVLRRAAPTAQALAEVSDALTGVSRTLDGSSDNILAILENWSRAIQFRDALGHVFRGEASFSADLLQSAISRLAPPARTRARRAPKADAAPRPERPADPRPAPPRKPAVKVPGLPPSLQELVDALPPLDGSELPAPKLDETVDGLLGRLDGRGTKDGGASDVDDLLDYLLGD